jgi:hypothetical protein
MKNRTTLLVLAAAFLILVGCTEKEAVQTVDWYKVNKIERDVMVGKCANNPGELMSTPNCINAIRAREITSLGAKRLQLEPLTTEQLMGKAKQ